MNDARALYDERLSTWRATTGELTRRDRLTSMVRLAFVIGGIALLFFQPYAGIALLVAFVILIVLHERTVRARTRAANAARFYERGLERLTNAWAGKGIDGKEFVEEHHPYSGDFDLFGRGSLYELLCIAATKNGRAR
ncbi:MAG TPA: DNA mismatch repair protein MutS, partial [Thermoanaerobaculia bacterium]